MKPNRAGAMLPRFFAAQTSKNRLCNEDARFQAAKMARASTQAIYNSTTVSARSKA